MVADVERSPKRLPRVQRLLTYYLPAAFRLGEGFGVLEATNRPDRARLAATGAVIARLDTVFARHADRLSAAAVEGLSQTVSSLVPMPDAPTMLALLERLSSPG